MLLNVLLLTTVLLVGQISALVGSERCVSGAVYTEADNRCRCDEGQKGHGTLCCRDEDLGVCFLRGDPILNTAHDLASKISYPCSANIAHIKKEINGKICEVRVATAGPYEDHGNVFNDRVRVYIAYGDSIKRTIELIDANEYLEPKISNVTHKISESTFLEKNKMYGIGLSLHFNSTNNITTLRACGVEVVYRPPNHSEIKQSLEPGICVISPKETIGSDLAEDVCNQDPDLLVAPYSNTEEKILASMISGYNSVDDKDFFDPQNYGSTCAAVSSVFDSCSDKASALSRCGHLLLSTQERRCLTDSVKVDVFPVFLTCLKASCKTDANACETIKSSKAFQDCHPAALKCDTWE